MPQTALWRFLSSSLATGRGCFWDKKLLAQGHVLKSMSWIIQLFSHSSEVFFTIVILFALLVYYAICCFIYIYVFIGLVFVLRCVRMCVCVRLLSMKYLVRSWKWKCLTKTQTRMTSWGGSLLILTHPHSVSVCFSCHFHNCFLLFHTTLLLKT